MHKRMGAMQPYLFPYLGYFQLISAVDIFVLSDDLQYINKGWINRNRFLIDGKEKMLTFPLRNASHLAKINERVFSEDFSHHANRILKSIHQAYGRSPCFRNVFPLVERIVSYPENNLARYVENSIREICRHLQIETSLVISSDLHVNPALDAQDRIIWTANKLAAETYINPIGGTHLYSFDYFASGGITLKFLRMDDVFYRQFRNDFVPYLSIIDVMMFNDLATLRQLLARYSLRDKISLGLAA